MIDAQIEFCTKTKKMSDVGNWESVKDELHKQLDALEAEEHRAWELERELDDAEAERIAYGVKINLISDKFKSGNDVPVGRVTISRTEWFGDSDE